MSFTESNTLHSFASTGVQLIESMRRISNRKSCMLDFFSLQNVPSKLEMKKHNLCITLLLMKAACKGFTERIPLSPSPFYLALRVKYSSLKSKAKFNIFIRLSVSAVSSSQQPKSIKIQNGKRST